MIIPHPGENAATAVEQLHGRFFEPVLRGNCYSIGCQLTALSAATVLLTASAQPIVGCFNPTGSGVNFNILQAALQDALNTLTTPAAPGSFVWASSVGNTAALSAGLAPFNRLTLAASGSAGKGFALSTASLLTGLVNSVVVFETAEFPICNNQAGTITVGGSEIPTVTGVQNFDGSLIVPPGGVLALLNTASTTAHSVAARLLWEEIPINL